MSETLYPHVMRAVLERPWAVLPSTLATIVEVVRMRASGDHLSREDIAARLDAAARTQGPRKGPQQGAVAVIPVYGVLSPRANLMSDTSGGTSVEGLRSMFRQAMADPEVSAVVFDVDSPGGMVDGIPEMASEILAARGTKPILANANTMAASAAYWLATMADEVTVSPSGSVGSIGVLAAHTDYSKAEELEGVKTTLIHHGKFKVEANPHEPLSEEARAAVQGDVDAYGAMFEAAVAKGMGVPVERVRSDFGQGRVHIAKDAVAKGMAHRIETLEETVGRAHRLAVAQQRAQAVAFALAPSDTITADRDVTPGSGSFADRLELVAAEVEAIARHAHERAQLRASEGRGLSAATRDGLRRLLSLRAALDDIEVLIAEPAPTRSSLSIDMAIEAARRGYPAGVVIGSRTG